MPGIDQGTVYALGTAFALWSDRVGGIAVSSSSNAREAECHGSLLLPGGRSTDFLCETKDGKTGHAKVDGVTYDLADGGLVAVSTQGGQLRVKQLKRNLTTFKFEQEAIADFAKTDTDPVGFFTEAPE